MVTVDVYADEDAQPDADVMALDNDMSDSEADTRGDSPSDNDDDDDNADSASDNDDSASDNDDDGVHAAATAADAAAAAVAAEAAAATTAALRALGAPPQPADANIEALFSQWLEQLMVAFLLSTRGAGAGEAPPADVDSRLRDGVTYIDNLCADARAKVRGYFCNHPRMLKLLDVLPRTDVIQSEPLTAAMCVEAAAAGAGAASTHSLGPGPYTCILGVGNLRYNAETSGYESQCAPAAATDDAGGAATAKYAAGTSSQKWLPLNAPHAMHVLRFVRDRTETTEAKAAAVTAAAKRKRGVVTAAAQTLVRAAACGATGASSDAGVLYSTVCVDRYEAPLTMLHLVFTMRRFMTAQLYATLMQANNAELCALTELAGAALTPARARQSARRMMADARGTVRRLLNLFLGLVHTVTQEFTWYALVHADGGTATAASGTTAKTKTKTRTRVRTKSAGKTKGAKGAKAKAKANQ